VAVFAGHVTADAPDHDGRNEKWQGRFGPFHGPHQQQQLDQDGDAFHLEYELHRLIQLNGDKERPAQECAP